MSGSLEEFVRKWCSNELEGGQGQREWTSWRTYRKVCTDPSLSGDVVVPVANCGVQEYNSNPKEHMPLRDYISYWKEFIQQDYSSSRGCLYLKDWHLCR